MKNNMLEANLYALGRHNPEIARALRRQQTMDPSSFSCIRSKSGHLVPVLRSANGVHTLHSRFDPEREAQRLLGGESCDGYTVVLGLGAGFHVAALLRSSEVSRILVVEPDPALARSTLEQVPMLEILADSRVALITGGIDLQPSQQLYEYLAERVQQEYMPFIDGSLRCFTLRSRAAAAPSTFQSLEQAVHAAEAAQARDHRAHRAYGRQWFRNGVLNLRALPNSTGVAPDSNRDAVVVAAGPSLTQHAEEIANRARSATLICCDTALGALRSFSIDPDFVVSIDCQIPTVLHFVRPSTNAQLIASVSSPTVLLRNGLPYSLFASSHPFEAILTRDLGLPALDMSAGNVTHTACHFAELIGAQRIHLYGADYSYPYGLPYARGTYFYDYLDRRQHRLRPYEAELHTFLRNREELQRIEHEGYWAFESALLARYRSQLAGSTSIPIVRIGPDGHRETVGTPQASIASQPAPFPERSTSAPPERSQVTQLVRKLRDRFSSLPISDAPLWDQLQGMNGSDRETLFALVPLASHFRSKADLGVPETATSSGALRAAQQYAGQLLEALQ